MPRYDFQCQKCQYVFEMDLTLDERSSKDCSKKFCPQCESKEVEQLMTFKGGINTKGSFSPSSTPCGGGGCGTGGSCPFN